MRIQGGLLALGILSATLMGIGSGWAATGGVSPEAPVVVAENQAAPGAADQPPPLRPMTDLEKLSVGCLVSGGGALAASYIAGPSEVVMLMMGGLVVPSSSSVLFISLIGTMTSVACGAGVAVEPLVEWAWSNASASLQASAAGDHSGSGVAKLGPSHAVAAVTDGQSQVAEMPKQAQ